jgi:hypothetical protein
MNVPAQSVSLRDEAPSSTAARYQGPMLRRRMLALVLAAVVAAGCLEEPADAAGGGGAGADALEAEALAFSLGVVETYLTGDYDAFRARLADVVYTLEGEGPFTREDVDGFFAGKRFPDGRDYSAFTMEDYLATYAPEMLTFEEAVELHPPFANMTWDGWTFDEDDLVFYGGETREGRESFLWTDLLAFAVTRETGEWRFKAFSG